MIDTSVSFTLMVNSTARMPTTITTFAVGTGVNTTRLLIWRRSRLAHAIRFPICAWSW